MAKSATVFLNKKTPIVNEVTVFIKSLFSVFQCQRLIK